MQGLRPSLSGPAQVQELEEVKTVLPSLRPGSFPLESPEGSDHPQMLE
jgi:hypothetical protein